MGKRKTKRPNHHNESNELSIVNNEVNDEVSSEYKPKKKKKHVEDVPLENSNVTNGTKDEKIDIPHKKVSKKKRKDDKESKESNSFKRCDNSLSNEHEEINGEHYENKLKQKKKKKVKENNIVDVQDCTEEQNETNKNKVTKKKKKVDKTSETETNNYVQNDNIVKNKIPVKELSETKLDKNKKIIFDDDTGEPQESNDVLSSANDTSRKRKHNIKKPNILEEEPDDADIDRFCDEIDEEDNVQYENWVKLIEARLGKDKKN